MLTDKWSSKFKISISYFNYSSQNTRLTRVCKRKFCGYNPQQKNRRELKSTSFLSLPQKDLKYSCSTITQRFYCFLCIIFHCPCNHKFLMSNTYSSHCCKLLYNSVFRVKTVATGVVLRAMTWEERLSLNVGPRNWVLSPIKIKWA